MKYTQLLLASASVLALGASASADFVNLEVVQFDDYFLTNHPNGNVRNAWATQGDGQLDVWRIYAVCNEPDDLLGTYGHMGVNQPMYLTNLTSGVFWNYTEVSKSSGDTVHFDLAPSSSKFSNPATAAAAFDTFATVGKDSNDSITFFTPSFHDGIDHFQMNWTTNSVPAGQNGGWAAIGYPAQGVATQTSPGVTNDGMYRVLLYQVTVAEGDLFEGHFGVAFPGPEFSYAYGSNTYFRNAAVPAPASMIVLAGFAATRRRRVR